MPSVQAQEDIYARSNKKVTKMYIGQWYWAENEDHLHDPLYAVGPFDSSVAALSSARTCLNQQLKLPAFYQPVYVGQAQEIEFPFPLQGEDIIESLRELLWQDYAVNSSTWLFNLPSAVVNNLVTGLTSAVKQWITENDLHPSWYGMNSTQCYEV